MMLDESAAEDLKCSKCGKWLENTGGDWSTCPDWCKCGGGLRRKLNRDDLRSIQRIKERARLKKVKRIARVEGKRGLYAFGGKTWRMVRPLTRRRASRIHPCGNESVFRISGRKYEFALFEEVKP